MYDLACTTQVYDDCMSGLNHAHPAPASDLSVNVAILQISAALERALGDVSICVYIDS